MSVFLPHILIGRCIMFENGHIGTICNVFSLGWKTSIALENAVLAIRLELPERSVLYSPQTGVNLTGQIYAPLSDIGQKLLILDYVAKHSI